MASVTESRAIVPQTQSAALLAVADQATVLASLPTAVVATDARGTVRFANRRAEELLRFAAADAIGRPIDEILAPLDELCTAAKESLDEEFRASIEITRNGEALHIGLQLTEIPGCESGESAWAIVFQDISGYTRLRDERDRLLKLATVGDVLPSILHELKNPLASIASAVELLVEDCPEGRVQDDLHAVLTEVRRMKLGFEGIGIVGRELHAGRNAAIDLAIREAVQIFTGRAEREGIELRHHVPDMPLLRVDPSVVRAIVFNLVNNAIHACRRGDPIDVSSRLVADGERLQLCVADGGCGMSPEQLSHCTTLFYTTKPSGSGIGLALCRAAAERAGGELRLESELGRGTNVTIEVPTSRERVGSQEREK